MDFYWGMAQLIGVHTLLGLSAYVVLQTGQVSMAQAGFFSVGAYLAGMLTVLAGWHLVPAMIVAAFAAGIVAAIVGFPALRVKGLMLVVATLAFGEAIRLFWFNFDYQIAKGTIQVGPLGGEGLQADPLLPRKRMDHGGCRRVHLGLGHRGHAGALVDGSLARRCGSACGGRG